MSETPSLSGKVAMITGASTGIGKASAVALAKLGVKVALAARSEDALQKAVEEITSQGGTAIGVKTDVTKRDQVKALAAETESKLGPVDIVVNSAGIWYYTLMTNLKEDAWEEMIDINCKGVLNSIGAVLDSMVKRKTGHIINISSDSGRRPFEGIAVYGGTKYFVEGMTASMRREVAQHGIRMTNVQPGDVVTLGALKAPIDTAAAELYDKSTEVQVLDAEDVARAVVYAASQPSHVAVNEVLVQPLLRPV
ncbi:uncharacterized oxidoreductase SAS2370 [Aplysia californica]|uniref:NADP-dependent 3-hydroxy acid dehydrogenase YdfG n=1 Tax=Aplysia californica TaxID=6500 RepID=A0ABM0K868_APLCA|nr:uncharacterized oxidoreductase SAS2370 [Aplysia californica]